MFWVFRRLLTGGWGGLSGPQPTAINLRQAGFLTDVRAKRHQALPLHQNVLSYRLSMTGTRYLAWRKKITLLVARC